MRREVNAIRRTWPARPLKAASWRMQAAWFIVKSRRKGLTGKERRELSCLMEANLKNVIKLKARWIVSLAETMGENGRAGAVSLVTSILWLVEKMNWPVQDRGSEDACNISMNRPDAHKHAVARLRRLMTATEFAMFLEIWKRLARDPSKIVGHFYKVANAGPVPKQRPKR